MPSTVSPLTPVNDELSTATDTASREPIKDLDWTEGHERAKVKDLAMLKDYDNEIDTLLVFAGLFSAILTAFIVDVYKDLKVDSTDTSAAVLQRILTIMEGDSRASIAPLPTVARPSPTSKAVLSLWFTSLILALLAALFAISLKQWLHVYSKWMDVAHNGIEQGLLLRKGYQTSWTVWGISDIFAALGVLLQLSLVLFAIGLVWYLWTLNAVVSPIVTASVVTMILLSLATILGPLAWEACPYKSPVAYIILKLQNRASGRDWTERDLPIAQRRLLYHNSSFDKSLVRTAILLDISLQALKFTLSHALMAISPGKVGAIRSSASPESVASVEARIRQLPAESARLLSEIVSEPVPSIDSTTTPTQPSNGDTVIEIGSPRLHEALLLWHLVFSCLATPQISMIHVVRHLQGNLGLLKTVQEAVEKQYVTLLVDVLLPQCAKLYEKGQLEPTRLSSVAYAMHEWADQTSLDATYACRISLRALKIAGDLVIGMPDPPTGLSPVTPFCDVVAALTSRAKVVQQLHAGADSGLNDLAAECISLGEKLQGRHNSFVCHRRTGYKKPGDTSAWPTRLTFSNSGSELFVGSDEAAAWAVDLTSGKPSTEGPSTVPNDIKLTAPLFSSNGSSIIWGSIQGFIFIFDRHSGTPSTLTRHDIGHGFQSHALAISNDGRYALVRTNISPALLCEITTGDIAMTFEGHSQGNVQAAFAPSLPNTTPRVAIASIDGTAMVWEIETGECLMARSDLGTPTNAVAWSPDATLVAVSTGNSVCLINSLTGSSDGTLEGHTKLVTGVAFSPDGKYIATCSNDRRLRIWVVDKRYKATCVAILAGPEEDMNRVAFSPDGSRVACAADDSVWIWNINATCVPRAVVEKAEEKKQNAGP